MPVDDLPRDLGQVDSLAALDAALAAAVTGSLRSAASLAGDLGRWVTIGVLLAAFAVAGLLTIGAVSRRVREFGTLRALGWTARRIIGQIAGEAAATGVAGAAIGVLAGLLGVVVVGAFAPALSVTAPRGDGSVTTVTVTVRVAAVMPVAAIGMAVLLALGGALLAGALGAWQASRLQPADAFSRVGLPLALCCFDDGVRTGFDPACPVHAIRTTVTFRRGIVFPVRLDRAVALDRMRAVGLGAGLQSRSTLVNLARRYKCCAAVTGPER